MLYPYFARKETKAERLSKLPNIPQLVNDVSTDLESTCLSVLVPLIDTLLCSFSGINLFQSQALDLYPIQCIGQPWGKFSENFLRKIAWNSPQLVYWKGEAKRMRHRIVKFYEVVQEPGWQTAFHRGRWQSSSVGRQSHLMSRSC